MKKLWLFLAAALLVLGLVGTSMAAIVTFGGSEYQFVSSSAIAWTDADAAAQLLGSGWHLVTITSTAEQNFVANTLLAGYTNGLFWAGGYQLPGASSVTAGWRWVTGEGWVDADAFWATLVAAEPNDWGGTDEIYLALDGRFARNWTWNDGLTPDSSYFGYIAERTTSVPEPSTLLLLGSGLLGLVGYGRKRLKK